MAEIISNGHVANGKPPRLADLGSGETNGHSAPRHDLTLLAPPLARSGAPRPSDGEATARLRRDYLRALRRYLAARNESELQQAYDLGRAASKLGLGLLDVVRVHHAVVSKLPDGLADPAPVEAFLLEALAPFEATHRGFHAAHDELRRRERQLAEAQKLAALGSFEWDWQSERMAVSEQIFRIQGLAPRRGGQSFDEFLGCIHPDDRDSVRKIFSESGRRAANFAINKRVVTPDARVRQVHLRGEVMPGPDGKPVRLLGFCQDITDRCRAEEMWRRYETIINTTREHLVLIDRRYRYQAVNDSYCEAQGIARAELIGRPLKEIWGEPMFSNAIKPHLDRCLAGEDVTTQGWIRLSPTVLRFYEFNCYPYRQGGRVTHAIVVARDMSERRRMEEELHESRAHYERLFNESKQMEETLRQLSNRILHAQEAERAHFSRELHDEVGQGLNAISMNLGTLERLPECQTPAAQTRLKDTLDLVTRTVETVHRFARELRPAMLDELGLEAALRAFVRGFAERTGLTVQFHGKLPGKLLAVDQRTVIYRVAQESLNNVAKHASATHVDVILWREGGQAILEIRDNGRGFSRPPRRVEPDRQRLGLLGMEERVRLVSGKFTIESRPNAGTIVRVEMPLAPAHRRAAAAGGAGSDSSPTPPQKQKLPL